MMTEFPLKPTQLFFEKRKIREIVHNRRGIARVIYNGYQIWPSPSDSYLELEKAKVDLSERNQWEDTNEVYTNRSFEVS